MFNFLVGFYTFLSSRKFASFGNNSKIKPILNSSHEEYISIGNNVDVGSFCRITVSTEFAGHKVRSKNKVRLKIGNNVDVGHNAFISANNNIQIGNDVIMSSYVFITDHDHGFADVTKNLHEQPLTNGGHVIIEDNVFLGVKCSILKNVTIGKHSVIGANAVVTKDIPPYSLATGNPAKVIKRYSTKTKKWVSFSNS